MPRASRRSASARSTRACCIPETVAPEPLGGSYQGIVLLDLNIKYDARPLGRQAREVAKPRSARRVPPKSMRRPRA